MKKIILDFASEVRQQLRKNNAIRTLNGNLTDIDKNVISTLNPVNALITTFDATNTKDGSVIYFAGRTSVNDGGGGLFTYSSTSTATVDNGIVFSPTGGGRLLREGWTSVGYNGAVNVKWFGAKGDNTTDDTTVIQSVINTYGGYRIYFPKGNYKITDVILVSNNFTNLTGDGKGVTVISQYTPNKDTIRFAPTTAGTTSDYLSRPSIEHMSISVASSAYSTGTSGAGVRFVQCDTYRLYDIAVNNAYEGITIEGGQMGSLKSFSIFSPLNPAGGADSALLHFKAASYGAGLHQNCYNTTLDDYHLSASKLKKSCIRIANADGLRCNGGNLAYGEEDLLRLVNDYDNSYISAVSFTNTYFDCVGPGQTPTAISIPNDAYTGTMIHTLKIGSGCTIGNGDVSGVVVTNPDVNLLSFEGVDFLNFVSWAINVSAGGSKLTLHVANNQFNTVGDVSSGAVRIVTGGRSLSVLGNTFNSVSTQCVQLGGTWLSGSVVGNSNNSAVPDIINTATFTDSFTFAGNSSSYPATTLANSWRGLLTGGKFGYSGNGVGGTVTQGSTSGKATGVTLNKLCGVITTDTASLAAGAVVSFTLSNTYINSNDILKAQRQSGGTDSSYNVWADNTASGSAKICIKNITAGVLAEAISIAFMVFRSDID